MQTPRRAKPLNRTAGHGGQTLHRLLSSREPTFGQAMRKELRTTVDAFADEFSKWLAQK